MQEEQETVGTSDEEYADVPIDWKLQIIMTEWDYVEKIIEHEMDQKTKARSWAITAFSAIFALSIHQSNENIVLLTAPVVMLFWFFDAVRQGTHAAMVEGSREIEGLLQRPTDSAILEFDAPMLGHHLRRHNRNRLTRRDIFSSLRIIFYGSMILGAFIMHYILR